MNLNNHIARRFLTDFAFTMEIADTMYGEKALAKVAAKLDKNEPLTKNDELVLGIAQEMDSRNNKNYYITNTVVDKLDLLKIKKKPQPDGKPPVFDWTVFKNLASCKKTFIFLNNSLLRINIQGDRISFIQLAFEYYDKKVDDNGGNATWELYYVNTDGFRCEHLDVPKMAALEEFTYKVMCFYYLSENEEIIVPAGQRYGTRKSGKLVNPFDVPVIIVNSKWNVTSINNNAFGVSGHFALRWVGAGRTSTRMVFIEPYTKSGITIKAKNK